MGWWMLRIGFADLSEPVAYLGGLAVYISVLTALAVTPIGDKAIDLFDDPRVLGMLLEAPSLWRSSCSTT